MQVLKFFLTLVFLFESVTESFTQKYNWLTGYELSGFTSTPRYDQTIDFIKRLAAHSEIINYTSFGLSPQGRQLPLLIVDKDGFQDVDSVRNSGKAIVLVQACIHAGESDGKDAGLMLLRDMVVHGRHSEVLDGVTILFVPILNVDGHENFHPYNRINQNGPQAMGNRVTAQRLNLNRDYLKADASEMQAMIRLYQTWLPDFFIDCHVTNGADYVYPITYGLDIHGNLPSGLTHWLKDEYLPHIDHKMQIDGHPIAPYMDFVEWNNPMKGIKAYLGIPRYSDGYAAINNRPALLIETHMLKNYKTRVEATYQMLLHTLQFIAKSPDKLISLNNLADKEASEMYLSDNPYTLTFISPESTAEIDYEGYVFKLEKSEISGGAWYKYSDKPVKTKIPFFGQIPEVSVRVPLAYIVPVEWSEIIQKLELHGVEMTTLVNDTSINVHTYIFSEASWRPRPFEGRMMVNYRQEHAELSTEFAMGSKIIWLNQRKARVVMHLLEPEGPDALIRWGFMNAIFEQKEYAESYVMEKLAREMLANDHELKKEFENKINTDTAFASSPGAILNWFYQKSPYWDQRLNLYPIGKIYRE